MQTQTNQPATHNLVLRFQSDKLGTLHNVQGEPKDLIQIIEDFHMYGLNKILKCGYLKPQALHDKPVTPFIPEDPLVYHCINPLQTDIELSLAKKGPAGIKQATHLDSGAKAPASTHPRTEPRVRIQNKNREHEKAFILLQGQTTVTCTETGITFGVLLPMYQGANLQTVHPLSFLSNVQDLIRASDKQGTRLEQVYERQVIAGMLITVLRNKGLLVCKDFPAANICLQRAKGETLSQVLRFFVWTKSIQGMPALHLVPEALYDFSYLPSGQSKEQCIADRIEIMIQNYVKVCRGEGEGNTKHTSLIERSKKQAGSVRVYGGNLSIESRQVKARSILADECLDKLIKENVGLTTTFREYLEKQIDAMMYLGTDKRIKIAQDVIAMFPNNKNAKELARLFASTKTESIELGLSTFSHEMEKEVQEFQGEKKKFNLMNLIKG